MRVFIPGIDGYLGWPLAQYLAVRDHEVAGCDSFLRRKQVEEAGSQSATPIRSMEERLVAFKEHFGKELIFKEGDLRDYDFVLECFKSFQPEAIVHLGEIPSAPYSMIDVHHCNFTQTNNIVVTRIRHSREPMKSGICDNSRTGDARGMCLTGTPCGSVKWQELTRRPEL